MTIEGFEQLPTMIVESTFDTSTVDLQATHNVGGTLHESMSRELINFFTSKVRELASRIANDQRRTFDTFTVVWKPDEVRIQHLKVNSPQGDLILGALQDVGLAAPVRISRENGETEAAQIKIEWTIIFENSKEQKTN